MFIGVGSPFFLTSLITNFENLALLEAEFAPAILKNIPFIFTILGASLSFLLINCCITSKAVIFDYKIGFFYRNLYSFLSKKWHFDQLANELVIHKLMNFGYRVSFQLLDKGSIEVFGPFGSSSKLWGYSKILGSLHSGMVFHYSFVMLFSILLFLCWLLSFNLNWGINSIFLILFSYNLYSIA